MNRLNTKTHFGSCLVPLALCIVLIVLSACAEGPDSSDEASSDTGSIAFNLVWEEARNERSVIAAAIFDCAGNGVVTVEATVYDGSDNVLNSGGPWNCNLGTGTISAVPAGSNRKCVLLGRDAGGFAVYRGEQTGITVTADQTTQVTITMNSLGTLIWDQSNWDERNWG